MVSLWEFVVVTSVIWSPLLAFITFMAYEAYDARKTYHNPPEPIQIESMFESKNSDSE